MSARTTMPTLASVYAEFNDRHTAALRAHPKSTEYSTLLDEMEMIVADVRVAFSGGARTVGLVPAPPLRRSAV